MQNNEDASKALQVFNNPQFGQLRTSADADGKIWFCLADVCKVLDIKNAPQAKNRLKSGGIYSIYITDALGREQEATFIDEQNLYRCIFQSRKKTATAFQDWVFDDVLPQIRKHGAYVVEKPDDTPEAIMARALKVANDVLAKREQRLKELETTNESQQVQINEQQKQIQQSAPKVQYYDTVLQSKTTMTATQIAKGLGMEARKLNKKLEEIGVLFKQSGQWMLKAPYSAWNMHSVRTHTYTCNDGSTGSCSITVFNEKGKRFITALHDNEWNVRKAIKIIKGEAQA